MLSIIPIPKKAVENQGSYTLVDGLTVTTDFDLPLLQAQTGEDSNFKIIKDDSIAEEGYTLSVKTDSITIKASTKTGAYYALQTIRKIGKTDLGSKVIPCCEIEDEPRFKWRGFSLDESRHFFGKDEIKRYLNFAFMDKLNVFHWHLTDDVGWRIEIKKYPLLTEIGSIRPYTQINGWNNTEKEDKPYGGFYTQDDIKEIVAFAKERGIMIVPEIDFPAHCAAVFAAYKQFACRESDFEVPGYFGGYIPEKVLGIKDWNRTICVGKKETFDFVYDVIDEVCDLFDAPYFHIGGDEAPKNEWKTCPNCQKVIKDNNLANEEDLQGWFNNKIAKYLATKGKNLIGWNEVLKANNLDKNVVVQYWTPQRDKRAEKFVNGGGKMIMSNHQSFYFDMTWAQVPLKNTYNYSPKKYGVNSENVKNILGVEGQIWTEWIRDRKRLDMCAFPRFEALAEVAWSQPSNMNWSDFKARLDDYKPTYDALGINYAVDKITIPTNQITKLKRVRKFYKSDTSLETRLNEQFKAKGER